MLRPLEPRDESASRAAEDELGERQFLVEPVGDLGWSAYLERLRAIEAGEVAGRWEGVAEVFRVAEVGGEVVGRVALKPTLTPWLAEVGGHVGYAVRPAFRRRGHATAICREALRLLGSRGLDRALLCCDETNVASAATIERCGGAYERSVLDGDVTVRRYWAATT